MIVMIENNEYDKARESLIEELHPLILLARMAGENINKYRPDGVDINLKNGDVFDPFTEADVTTDELIRSEIAKLFPDDKVLSEENSTRPENYSGNVWMIDPLDGTKDFINGFDRYSVMIGQCIDGIPTIGLILNPTTSELFFGKKGHGSWRIDSNGNVSRLAVSSIDNVSSATLIASRASGEPREMEAYLRSVGFANVIEDSSFGLRAASIGVRNGDVFVCTNNRACKWDVCAPQVILEEAGGKLTNLDGSPIDYTSPSYKLDKLFAGSNGLLHDSLIELLAK